MEFRWRQATIAIVAATAVLAGGAGCGDDDDEAPAPQAAEATTEEPATPEETGSELDREEPDGGASTSPEGAPANAEASGMPDRSGRLQVVERVLSSERFTEDLRRWRTLRAQLSDESTANDERAQAELDEVEERLREELAEARQGQGPRSEDLPDYEFGEGPGFDQD